MAVTKITGKIIVPEKIVEETEKEVKSIFDYKKKFEEVLGQRVTEMMEVIAAGAIWLDASDLHIEPSLQETRIRARVDGILQDVLTVDTKSYQALLSRIKLLSGIKLNISDRPQDGRFSVAIKDYEVEVRVSTLPAEYGESVVMRVLNPKSLIDLGALGLREDLLTKVLKEIKKPHGMIIVTGPTGSGKTTTLYAFLRTIQKPGIKIITIEDPIEYHLKGISQTQVAPKKGYDFASGLRSVMRQDPDVILVGEMRDSETVNTALQAALTGHLVLSTLHTNDTAGTVARLVSLKANPANIGPAINMVIAQRLVRVVCQDCVSYIPLSEAEIRKFKNAFKEIRDKVESPEIGKETKVAKTVGCPKCNSTGFRGRIGIFETFLIDEEAERFIRKSTSIADIREFALKRGMIPMYYDGLIKVFKGITTMDELERVMGEF